MAITTITVTGPILDASGVAYDKAAVRFTPRGVGGDDAGDTVIVQTPVEVRPAASTGAFSISLAPSASVAYDVLLVQYLPDSEKTYRLGTITVPVSGPVALQDLLPVFDPGLPTNAELLAALSAAVASAEAAADRAEAASDYMFPSFVLRSAFVTWAGLNTVAEGTVIEAGGLAYIKRAAFTALPGLSGWDAYASYLPDHAGGMPGDPSFDNGAALSVYWGNIAGRGTQPTAKGIYYVNTRGAMSFTANGGGFTADWTGASIDVSQTGTAGTSNSVIRLHGTAGAQVAMTYATTVASTNVASTTVTARDGSGNPVAHNLAVGDDVFLSSLDVFDVGYSALNDKRGQRAVVSTVPSTTTFTTFDAIHDALTTSPVYQKIDYFKDANIIGLRIVGSGRFDTSVGDIGINMLWCNNVHITYSNIRYIDYNGIRMDNCTHCTVDKWTGVIQETDATEEFSAHVLLLNGSQDCHITHGLSWGARHPVDYSSNSNRGIGRNCTVAYNHAYGCFYGMATHGSAVDCTFLYNNVYNSLFGVNTRSPGWSIIGMYGANVSEVVRLTLNPENVYISGTRGKKVNYLVRMAPGIDLFGTKETGNITILDSQGVEIGDNAINISPELPYFTQADAAVTAASTTTLIVIGALGGFWDSNRALEGSYIDIDPDGAGGTGTVTRFISNDTWTGTVHQLTIAEIATPETDATYTIYSGTKMGGLVIDGVNVDGCEFSPVYVKGAWTGGYIDNINAQADAAVAQPVVRVATAVGQRQVNFAIGNNIRYDNYQPPRYDDPDLTWRPHMAGIRDGGAFETRAAAVTWIAAGGKIADKEYFIAGSLPYVGKTGATTISDMDDVVPYGDLMVDHWATNTTPGTTLMTDAISSADAYSVATGLALRFSSQTYRAAAPLTVAGRWLTTANIAIDAKGSRDTSYAMTASSGFMAENLNITLSGENHARCISLDGGCKIDKITGATTSFTTIDNSNDCFLRFGGAGANHVGRVEISGHYRAIINGSANNEIGLIGGVHITDYVQGILAEGDNLLCGNVYASETASEATGAAGENAILDSDGEGSVYGNITVNGAGEHSVRIGGTSSRKGPTFGRITSVNPAGSHFKCNGADGTRIWFDVAGIDGEDGGSGVMTIAAQDVAIMCQGVAAGSRIGPSRVYKRLQTYSSYAALEVDAIDGLTVDLTAEDVSHAFIVARNEKGEVNGLSALLNGKESDGYAVDLIYAGGSSTFRDINIKGISRGAALGSIRAVKVIDATYTAAGVMRSGADPVGTGSIAQTCRIDLITEQTDDIVGNGSTERNIVYTIRDRVTAFGPARFVDLDAGRAIYYVNNLADDASIILALPPRDVRAMIEIWEANTSAGSYGKALAKMGPASSTLIEVSGLNAEATATNGTLNGTTGTDGAITYRLDGSDLHVENRRGSLLDAVINITFLQLH